MDELQEEQIEEFRAVFNLFDKSGEGTIATQQVEEVIKSFGTDASPKELRRMMKAMDPHGKGNVNIEDFLKIMARQIRRSDPEGELLEAFRAFDHNRSGFISASELRKVMSNMGQKMSDFEIMGMINEADVNGDGKINFEEFLKFIVSKKGFQLH